MTANAGLRFKKKHEIYQQKISRNIYRWNLSMTERPSIATNQCPFKPKTNQLPLYPWASPKTPPNSSNNTKGKNSSNHFCQCFTHFMVKLSATCFSRFSASLPITRSTDKQSRILIFFSSMNGCGFWLN